MKILNLLGGYCKRKSTILLVLCIVIVYSCKKDKSSFLTESFAENINQAKQWYEQKYPKVLSGTAALKPNSISQRLNFSQILEPDWNSAESYSRLSQLVCEVPIAQNSRFATGLKTNVAQSSSNKDNSRSSLLILNNGKGYNAYVMTIIADSSYLKNNKAKLALNKYNYHEADFSGMLLYSTLDGAFLGGWKYNNGKVTGYLESSSVDVSSAAETKSVSSKKQLERQCTAYYADYYWGDVFLYSIYLGTTCVGGGMSDYDPGLEPGFPGPPGGGGGTTEQHDPVQKDTASKIVNNYCDNTTIAQKDAITSGLNMFFNYHCINKAMINAMVTSGVKIDFCIDSSIPTSGQYNNALKAITLKTIDDAIPSVIGEELFHYYQSTKYQNMSQYGVNTGWANIEFEAALWRDIKSGQPGAVILGTEEQKQEYKDWLSNITNGYTTYPSTMADLQNKYTHFLSIFSETHSQFGTPISMNPQAIFDNFLSFGCN